MLPELLEIARTKLRPNGVFIAETVNPHSPRALKAFWIDPTEDMIVILLTQLMPSSLYPIRRELRVLTYQALVD